MIEPQKKQWLMTARLIYVMALVAFALLLWQLAFNDLKPPLPLTMIGLVTLFSFAMFFIIKGRAKTPDEKNSVYTFDKWVAVISSFNFIGFVWYWLRHTEQPFIAYQAVAFVFFVAIPFILFAFKPD